MNEESIKARMQSVLDTVVNDLGSIRTGRATPALVEDIIVSVYGGTQRLRIMEIGSTTSTDPQTLVIDPWDKSIIGEIRNGILSANVGLNPSIDGEILRITLPPLTTEDRERYVKLLSTKLENGRVMVRQIRAEAMKSVKETFEKKEISEDEKARLEKKVQELTDEFVRKIEETGKKKEAEILNLG